MKKYSLINSVEAYLATLKTYDRLEKYYNKYRKISVIECENDINIKNNNIKKAIETL